MTDEQKQTVAGIRQHHEKYMERWKGNLIPKTVDHVAALLRIVDDLQKEVEQLTKERDEARAWAEKGRDIAWMYYEQFAIEYEAKRTPLPWEKR